MTDQSIAPIGTKDRIISLDVLRGFAILGILIMNMISFAMPGANYLNPMAMGELEGLDKIAFYFSQLFANQKFMSLFSILFGAGIILMTGRMESKGLNPAKRHYLRNLWLLLIGLAHAHLLWYGDVLVPYALCSIWLFLFRKKAPKTLFIWALVFLIISSALSLFAGFSMSFWSETEINELCETWLPGAESLAEEITVYTGSYLGQLPDRIENAISMETFIFFWGMGWQITGLMLIGMGLFKSKVLTAERTNAFYKKMIYIGLFISISLGILGLLENYANDWACEYSFFIGSQFNFWGSVPMALAYIGIIMLICRSNGFQKFKSWMAPVGRMALTNYLLQTIIATTIFYGHGFGLFGSVGRAEQWIYVFAIWVFQIILSNYWLKKFRFGPFEWMWRSLTYWKFQPMKKKIT